MSKGSKRRPGDEAKYRDQYDKIDWGPPKPEEPGTYAAIVTDDGAGRASDPPHDNPPNWPHE